MYRQFVEDMLGETYESPLNNTIGSSLLGSAEFMEEITTSHLKDKAMGRDVLSLGQLATQLEPEEIVSKVKTVFADNEKLARQVAMHLCHKYSGAKLREIGKLFNVG